MLRAIKLLGVVVMLIGIVANLLDLCGWFVSPKRLAFGELVMGATEGVPRATPGFEPFLRDFPPPSGIASEDVTHIADKTLRWDTSAAESLAVAYVANGIRTSSVARLDEVRDWANATIYGWVAWFITAIGAVGVVAAEFVEFVRERKRGA